MAVTSAVIMAGFSHPFDGGLYPRFMLQLKENSRPHLEIRSMDNNDSFPIMITTYENMADDVMLAIASLVFKFLEIPGPWEAPNRIHCYEDFSDEQRQQLYAETRKCLKHKDLKVTFSLFTGCHLLHQIEVLKSYPIMMEIGTPVYDNHPMMGRT